MDDGIPLFRFGALFMCRTHITIVVEFEVLAGHNHTRTTRGVRLGGMMDRATLWCSEQK